MIEPPLEQMRVLGIDYSTRSVDLVAIPYEDEGLEEAAWRSIDLLPPRRRPGEGGGLRAALLVRERLPRLLGWDSIALSYIEQPYSQNRSTLAALSQVEGAIIASLPANVRRGAISEIPAQAWKRVLCGHADASKDDVRQRVEQLGLEPGLPQDVCDAAGIAWAARTENQRAVALAEWPA